MTHNTFYENAIHYKENEIAFIKNYKCGIASVVFVIKLHGGREGGGGGGAGESITEIFQ